jgi:hypothetical protein
MLNEIYFEVKVEQCLPMRRRKKERERERERERLFVGDRKKTIFVIAQHSSFLSLEKI